jgi:hypothetical protein
MSRCERLKCQFSQVKRDLYLQKIPKLVAIPNKRTLKKKTIVVKMKMKKLKKISIICSKKSEKKKQ